MRENVDCDPGFFYTWWRRECLGACWLSSSVGDTLRVWIVEVGGTRLFVEAQTTRLGGSNSERDIQQIIGSIRFG